jgi:hypothetical protein
MLPDKCSGSIFYVSDEYNRKQYLFGVRICQCGSAGDKIKETIIAADCWLIWWGKYKCTVLKMITVKVPMKKL